MPICPTCGTNNSEENAFCPSCGTTLSSKPVWEIPSASSQPGFQDSFGKQAAPSIDIPDITGGNTGSTVTGSTSTPVDTLPTLSRILGLVSMITGIVAVCTFMYGILFGPAAIILSVIANKKNTSTVKNSKAKIGLITGIIGIVTGLFWCVMISNA